MIAAIIKALVIVYLLWAAWETKVVLSENWEEIWKKVREKNPLFADICGFSAAARGITLAIWVVCTFCSIAFYAAPWGLCCRLRDKFLPSPPKNSGKDD